jgi:hypothetical protein
VKAEVEYTALVSVKVDLETGEVASVGIHATRRETASRRTSTIKTLALVRDAVYALPSTLSDAVMTLLSVLSYRTQSWSMSMPIAGL